MCVYVCVRLSPTTSCSNPSSRGGGGGGGVALRLGHPPGSLYSPIFAVSWVWAFSFDHIELAFYTVLFHCAILEGCGCPSLALRRRHPWFYVTIILSFSEPCRYLRLSWNALSLRTTLPEFSFAISSGWLLFCHFGGLVLTYGSPSGLCLYMWLSSLFFSARFRSRKLCYERMILLAVGCPQIGSFFWGPAFNLPIFGFLVSFCCPCSAATDLIFIFGSLLPCLAYSFRHRCTVVNRVLAYACPSFLFFPIACHYMQLSLFFLSIHFRSLSIRCFEQFRLRFVYLDSSSSIFGIRLLMLFLVFLCISACVSQRPSLVFIACHFQLS